MITRRMRGLAAAVALTASAGCGPWFGGQPGAPGASPAPNTGGGAETAEASALVVTEAEVTRTEISGTLEADPEVEALVAPFRARMELRTEEVLGEATGPLRKQGEWESTLGNFSADAMLHTINELVSPRVHVAVTNNGGLRVPIQPGPITVGLMYELMPFENMMVVETFTGAQMRSLADELVAVGGEPMAGMRITVDDEGDVVEVTIDGAPLDAAAEYRLVTSDYLANGNGNLPTLWEPVAREELGVPLRDAFIGYVRDMERIEPTLDGRIGWARPPGAGDRPTGGRR